MAKVILILFLLIILTACSQDPWAADQIEAEAKANETEMRAEQYALTQEQQRQQAADLHAVQMEQERLEQARREAVEQDVRDGWTTMIRWSFLFLTAGMVYAIFEGTKSTVAAYQTAAAGIAGAIVQSAEIRSRLIYLDDGRQFPALVDAETNMITDITTGATVATDESHPGDPQAIAGAIANRHVGIVAKETRRSHKDTAPSTALAQNPPIIEAKFSDVREYFDRVTKQRKDADHE